MPRNSPRLWPALNGFVLVALASLGLLASLLLTPPSFSPLDGRAPVAKPTVNNQTLESGAAMTATEDWFDDRVPGRHYLLAGQRGINHRLFRSPVIQDVFVGDPNGFLYEAPSVPRSVAQLAVDAKQLTSDLKALGVPILWVRVPRKEEVFSDRLPTSWRQAWRVPSQSVLAAMQQAGPTLDLSPILTDLNKREKYYWRTDHHWTDDGTLASIDPIVNKARDLGALLGTDTRTYQEQDFGVFYGSGGRKVTMGATPRSDNFRISLPPSWRARACPINEISTNQCAGATFLRDRAEDTTEYAGKYLAFIGDNAGLQRTTNTDPAARGRVLLLKDSYGNTLSTYLAERTKELIAIDERIYSGPSIKDLVKATRPDIVIVLHNQYSVTVASDFDSQTWVDAPAAWRKKVTAFEAEKTTGN